MKTILITGASSGFGKMLVQSLASTHKYNIVATLRKSTTNESVKEELKKLPKVEVLFLDVTQEDEVVRAVNHTIEKYGKIDVLVNNAGVFGGGLLEAHSIDQVQRLFDVNVYGPLRLIKAVAPSMRSVKDGLIINISSMLGFFSIPLNSVYCASKFALEALVTGSYYEFLQSGVENILIEPGTFPTDLYAKSGVKADLEEVSKSYNEFVENMSDFAAKAVYNAIQTKKPDPKAVVDKIMALIEMEKGTRPLRNPIDQISGEQFAQKVADDIAALSQTQMKAYGF
jgi:NADP-dependent 3-hydroxy acid dehydrogenase YdfG